MSGQMRKYNFSNYKKQLESMEGPILVGELPKVKLDLKGAREYAQKKGVTIAALSEQEKRQFMTI